MSRAEVFAMVQAHLVDELEVDPARIDESTNFRVDLEADSLDLYTLVQELEDSFGVKMTDEQAARIATVGQAVDFVLGSPPRPHDETPDDRRGCGTATDPRYHQYRESESSPPRSVSNVSSCGPGRDTPVEHAVISEPSES